MNATRAKKIADRFSGNMNFVVHPLPDGLLVRYHKHTHFFEREPSFWTFVYRAAGLPAQLLN